MPISVGDRWRRTGSVKARPAVEGELVDSLEGQQTAHAGDWVIKGAKGEQWVTSGDHFAANYERSREIWAACPGKPPWMSHP